MQQRPHKGGDVKKAPPGFYLPRDARSRLGVTPAVFRAMVTKGELERIVPPGRSEGFFRAAQINKEADKQALFYLQNVSSAKYEPTEFAQAKTEDIDGIFNVIASLWGADKATPIDLRRSWYKANDRMDFIVKFRGLVLGYVNLVPYIPQTLEAMMAGRMRGWDISQNDILPYEPGKSYDGFTGIAVRQDIPGHEYYAKRLIYGFFGALCDMAREGIIIRRMYATSDQPFGIKISQDLGFRRQPEQPGDLFGRFILDMETADTMLVRRYRETVQRGNQHPRRVPSRKIKPDARLEAAIQDLLDTLTESDTNEHAQTVTILRPFIDQLSRSSQMTLEQQNLLKSVHEILATR